MTTRSVFALFISITTFHGGRSDEPILHAAMDESGVLVSEGDQPVLFYQRATKSLDGKWPRAAYVHPLYDLRGNVITEDFPDDHRHHRGIFWSWHQVWLGEKRLGDPWVCKDFVWDVQSIETMSPAAPLMLIADVHWLSPHHQDDGGRMIPVVHERTTITVHAGEPSYRLVDFEIAIQALLAGVRIGGSEDVKGYGGFSPRIKLSGDERFLAARGEVEPAKTAIDAGSWINVAGNDRGIVMMAHPGNPTAASQVGENGSRGWILRRRRSMQNAVYPGPDPVALSAEQPTRLRYRLVIHDGNLSSEDISLLEEDF